jgi:hypothetical protein
MLYCHTVSSPILDKSSKAAVRKHVFELQEKPNEDPNLSLGEFRFPNWKWNWRDILKVSDIQMESQVVLNSINENDFHSTELSNPPAFRRLRKLLSSDLPYRFTQNT